MKKLLLASTALVATAGFAAADVALSGSAEIGVKKQLNTENIEFHQDVDVRFSMTGESDNGVSFGATIDLDDTAQQAGGIRTDIAPDYNVFVSAGSATLTMGDTDGAFDKAMTEVDIGGALADDHTTHAGFSGNAGLDGGFDGQVARFDYAFDTLTVSVSVEMDDEVNAADDDTDTPIYGLGFAYSAELAGLDLGLGLGYQSQDDAGTNTGISISTTFDNGLQAILNYSNFDPDPSGIENLTHTAIGLGYTANELTVGFNWGQFEQDGDVATGYGLAVNYDLGGGLVAQFGYGHSQLENDVIGAIFVEDVTYDADTAESYSLGLAMSF